MLHSEHHQYFIIIAIVACEESKMEVDPLIGFIQLWKIICVIESEKYNVACDTSPYGRSIWETHVFVYRTIALLEKNKLYPNLQWGCNYVFYIFLYLYIQVV